MKKYIIGTIILVLLALIIINQDIIKIYKVNGHSMYPKLYDGYIVISKKESSYQKGDIVVINHHDQTAIKRIISTSGELVNITEDGSVYINDILIQEDYVEKKSGISDIVYPHLVANDSFFVLGDNRDDSYDSRIPSFGDVNKNEILGKVIYVFDTSKNS